MVGEIKDGKTVPFGVKIAIWTTCALLFVGLSLVGMLVWKRKSVMLSAAPVVFASSMPFILMLGVLALHKAGLKDWTWEAAE